MKKYRIIAFILSILLLLTLASCSNGKDDKDSSDDSSDNSSSTTKNNPTNTSGRNYDYDDMSQFLTLPNYKGHVVEVPMDYVQNTIDSYLMEFATTLYKAQRGDDIYVNLKFTEVIYLDEDNIIDQKGNVIESLSKTDYFIDELGDGNYNKTLEDLIIEWGVKITKSTEKIVTLPNDPMFGDYAGKKVYFSCEFIDKECKLGDVVSVTYTGYYTDGNGNIRLNEMGEKDYFDFGSDVKFYLGSFLAIEDFEKGIVGMRLGESNKKQIEATFPYDYIADELRNQKVIFEVTVDAIYSCPEYDNDFAKLLGYNTTEDLENDIISTFAESNMESWLIENTVFYKYPEREYGILEDEFEELNTLYSENYGMTFESYISMYYGMTKDEYIKSMMETDLIYYGIASAERILPSSADLERTKEKLINEYTEQFLDNYGSITEAEARERAIETVNNDIGEAGIYDETIFSIVDSFIDANYTVRVLDNTYESVTNQK